MTLLLLKNISAINTSCGWPIDPMPQVRMKVKLGFVETWHNNILKSTVILHVKMQFFLNDPAHWLKCFIFAPFSSSFLREFHQTQTILFVKLKLWFGSIPATLPAAKVAWCLLKIATYFSCPQLPPVPVFHSMQILWHTLM